MHYSKYLCITQNTYALQKNTYSNNEKYYMQPQLTLYVLQKNTYAYNEKYKYTIKKYI